MSTPQPRPQLVRRRLRLAFATAVALATSAACTRELHRRQGAVVVTGDGWGEIAPCG